MIGTDDSFLSRPAFRASWALLVVSGIFCTVGSVSENYYDYDNDDDENDFDNDYMFMFIYMLLSHCSAV